MPMSDFISVVFPMPLRPTTTTISAGATLKLSPCSTSLCPYPACRSITFSTGCASVTKIDLHDLRVGFDVVDRALGDDAALMQHRNLVSNVADEIHVVLDHQHRAVLD